MNGSYDMNSNITAFISIGAVVGAQTGARLSSRVKGRTIMVSLAVVLLITGLRLVIR